VALWNYSRKILAWTVAERLEPTATCQFFLAAGRHMVFAGRLLLFGDSGIENINSAVDNALLSACLERVLAQIDVAYSNSLVEAFWRSMKHPDVTFGLLRPDPRTSCTSARRSTCQRNWPRPGARHGRSGLLRTER